MKSRSEIWLCALEELGALCSVDTQRDAETLAQRVTREGDTFFKVALPKYGKDFEQALSMRRIPRSLFRGFKRKKLLVDVQDEQYGFILTDRQFGGGNPRFLGGFLDLVFRDHLQMTEAELSFAEAHPDFILCPQLRSDPRSVVQMVDAVTSVRQLCLMFGKEKERCSDSRVKEAYSQYIETDQDLVAPLRMGEQPVSSEMGSSPYPLLSEQYQAWMALANSQQ